MVVGFTVASKGRVWEVSLWVPPGRTEVVPHLPITDPSFSRVEPLKFSVVDIVLPL